MFLAALRPSRNAQTETSRSSATPMIKAVCSTGLAPRIVVRFSALDSTAPGAAQGAFKNGAATASSPRFVNNLSFFGDEPFPPLLAHFLERALATNRKPPKILKVHVCPEQYERSCRYVMILLN